MRQLPFVTVDVFTDTRFGGNPLAVFTDGRGVSDTEMQALAAEMNYSETTFVLPPADPANSARVRIFNRTAEMPFAGHPNVGTAYVLASADPAISVLRFEEIAGLVEVRIVRDGTGAVTGAEIGAPQPLQTLGEMPVAIAPCLGLTPADLRTDRHLPIRATTGVDFLFVEVVPEALARATPDPAAYARANAAYPAQSGRLSIFVYARCGDDPAAGIRARMFSPLTGTWEDAATGSANATLGALLLSLTGGDALAYEAVQGVEMGRPSRLSVSARRTGDGIFASVGGQCVPVLRGDASL
ncbi:PhzF family phenazine biosynthesis protein [Sphingoaurantiacus capsulatus]|uniref:PhzF family phenazine biosynthesis protein n=1 Tax=Sphingoaurantiacus capsulatus TaxID=1771310 RepID=A0ABV7X8X0_9SPHN